MRNRENNHTVNRADWMLKMVALSLIRATDYLNRVTIYTQIFFELSTFRSVEHSYGFGGGSGVGGGE